MPKKKTPAKSVTDEMLLGALVTAYQAEKIARREWVRLDDVKQRLSDLGASLSLGDLEVRIKQLLGDYQWLGLVFDERKSEITAIPGIHWFTACDMYGRLAMSQHEKLAQIFVDFAEQRVKERDAIHRLLVDAGSTTFRALSHPAGQLASNQRTTILTNNLFIAQWLKNEKVTLISGSWDLKTGAIVNPPRFRRTLNTTQMRPSVGIMSWHYAEAEKDDIVFYTQHENETEVKFGLLETTTTLVFMLVSSLKFTAKPPSGAPKYGLDQLVELQNDQEHIKKFRLSNQREIYLITDFEEMTPELERVTKLFKSKRVKDSRIYLVSYCEEANTRPPK